MEKTPDRILAWRKISKDLEKLGFTNIDGGDIADGGIEETYQKGDFTITIKYLCLK